MQSPMSMQRLCTKPAPGRVVVRCAPRAQSGNPIEALQKTVQRAVSTKAASVSEAPRQSEAADKKAPAGERLAKGDFPRPPPADLIPQTKAGADVKQPSRDSAVMFQGKPDQRLLKSWLCGLQVLLGLGLRGVGSVVSLLHERAVMVKVDSSQRFVLSRP